MSNGDRNVTWAQIVDDPSVADDLDLGENLLLYFRSSTDDQSKSCPQQARKVAPILREAGILRPGEEFPREGALHRPDLGLYADPGVSGWKKRPDERPGSGEMLEYIKENPQDRESPGYVLVYSLSRYGRFRDGPEEAIHAIYDLKRRGWRIASVTEPELDTDDKHRLMRVIKMAVTSERDTSSSEVKSTLTTRGNDDAAEKGIWRGGRAPFGYRRIVANVVSDESGEFEKLATLEPGQHNGYPEADTLLEPDPVEAEWVKWAFEAYAHGDGGEEMSLFKIAQRLNEAERDGQFASASHRSEWYHTTVKKLFSNESYVAVQRDSSGERQNALWEPLVSPSLWRKVQAKLEENRGRQGNQNKGYLLSGLLRCSECGKRYYGTKNKSGDHYLYYYRTKTKASETAECSACQHRIRVEDVELPLITLLEERVANHPAVQKRIQRRVEAKLEREDDPAEVIEDKERELQAVDDRINRLLDLHLEGAATSNIQDRLNRLERKKGRIESELEQLRRDAEGATEPSKQFARLAANFGSVLKKAAPAERKQLAESLIVQVEVDQRDKSAVVHLRDPDGGLLAVA